VRAEGGSIAFPGLEKGLANLWRGKRITKKPNARRGQETKWEIPIKMYARNLTPFKHLHTPFQKIFLCVRPGHYGLKVYKDVPRLDSAPD
jgi:hypothetical protein